ncbi:MAG: hypothetical protein MK085_05790 [Phycisphaerales bacterium]|nr:hypothetical protein [Phycisphaerales bacterium]
MKTIPHTCGNLLLAILLVMIGGSAAAQQTEPIRDDVPSIELLEAGEAPRALQRWNMDEAAGGTIQVVSRTGKVPDREGRIDPNSIERIYTLQGAFLRSKPVKAMIWRILDASAKIPSDPLRTPKTAKPGENPGGPIAPPDSTTGEATGNEKSIVGSGEADGIDPTVEAHSRLRLRLRTSVLSLQKLKGGTLRQKVTPNGIVASGTVAILEKSSARGYSEAMKLANLLGLGDVLLPDAPIGVGARWRAVIRNDSSNTPMTIEVTWTLLEQEEGRMKIGVEYARRLASAANDPKTVANRKRVERNGRGVLSVDLDRPMAIEGSLIEEQVFPASFTLEEKLRAEATWITIRPIENAAVSKPAPNRLAPAPTN